MTQPLRIAAGDFEKMSDEKLIQFGKDAAYMSDPLSDPKIQREVRPEFVIQLRECRTEWRRRYPKKALGRK